MFLALVLVPKWLRTRAYHLEVAVSPEASFPTFPLDTQLSMIQAPGTPWAHKKTVVLRELLPGKDGSLIINFWATWCPPCLEEFPSLEYLGRQLGTQPKDGLPRLVTISVDQKADEVLAYFKTAPFEASAVVLHDPQGEFSRGVGTQKFPESYPRQCGRKRFVLYKWVGPENWLSRGVIQKLHQLAPVGSH